MRLVVAAVLGLISAATLSGASAQGSTCHIVRVQGASFLEECGKQLNSFHLSMSEPKLGSPEIKRGVGGDIHGRFYFACPVEPMCEVEPAIGGFFIAADTWQKSSKDERAIYQVSQGVPLMAVSSSRQGGPLPEMPTPACPLFDVSVDGMEGRAVCFENESTKFASVVIVAADNHVGFLLYFSQHEKSMSALKEAVDRLLPRFRIERATGDVGLLKWMQ